jgi:hypothetical protein
MLTRGHLVVTANATLNHASATSSAAADALHGIETSNAMLNASISGLRSFSALTWVAIGLSMGPREDFRGKILVRDILGVMGSLLLGSGHS